MKPFDIKKKWMCLSQVISRLHLSKEEVKDLVSKGRIEKRLKGNYKYNTADVESLIIVNNYLRNKNEIIDQHP